MGGKSIVVAGAGGNIGSHFTRHLARMPEVGRVVLVDRDVYEQRNLANQDILPRDVGKPKVAVQARRLAEIRPDLEVHAIHAPLESLPLGAWRVDLIAACLDSRAARQAVNERAWRLGSSMGRFRRAGAGVAGARERLRARVRCAVPGMRVVGRGLPAAGAELPVRRGGRRAGAERCVRRAGRAGGGDAGAGMPQAAGGRNRLRRGRAAGDAQRALAPIRGDVVPPQPALPVRSRHVAHRAVALRHARTRIADLLALAETVRVPGRRFVRRLVCPACCREKRLFRLDASLDAAVRACGACRRPMAAPGFDIVESSGPRSAARRAEPDAGGGGPALRGCGSSR